MRGKITSYDPNTGQGQLEVELQVFNSINVVTKEILDSGENIKIRGEPTIGKGGGVIYWFIIAENARKTDIQEGATVDFDESLEPYVAKNLRR
ncbi:hypothetical protein BK673_19750 [Pseudomonas fluorescens]|jgi:hypothetical protein|uniref:Uncharacterized protein n=1 Tax=Pseudomonas fluorescens TaxID=294 RepID=A0A423P2M5_PSEFL|nr:MULTISPECIES: hypothetical protein [Pseudomonas fluorescens group]OOH80165.1 hypothetical protein BOW65_14430 [Pseudomonas koreensis]ROO06033.1 hypothetical protein BK673_19750 [Pseudomonas fluorescens]